MYHWFNLPPESVLWGRRLLPIEFDARLLETAENLDYTIYQGIQEGVCQRCKSGKESFYQYNHQAEEGWHYCLNCLQMGRISQKDKLYAFKSVTVQCPLSLQEILTWQGELSKEQARASKEMIESLTESMPHLINAVTGAGKTEMIFPVVQTVLSQHGRVAIVSPRIDVCLELKPRLEKSFKKVPSILLYGESKDVYEYTPLVVATVHQLLRFDQAFDLVIVDEVDAFPYAGDASLHYAVDRAVKTGGKIIYLTATPDYKLLKMAKMNQLTMTTLPARFHGYPLPVPKFIWLDNWAQAIADKKYHSRLIRQISLFMKLNGVKLIFMPSIYQANDLFEWLVECGKIHPNQWQVVHSQDEEREQKVQALREGRLTGLITTTILERGVTFTNCHVLIIGAESKLYTLAALVQMSGRVGRRPDYPTGQLLYGHFGVSYAMQEARRQIIKMNRLAKQKGLVHYSE